MEVRYNINKSCVFLFFKSLFKTLYVYSVIFNFYAAQLNAVCTEAVERADKIWGLRNNNVALVSENLCCKIHYLLCTAGDYE